MCSKIKTVKSLAMVILLITLVSNTNAQSSKFSISVNALTTNFNYGEAGAELKPYKKDYRGLQAGFSYQAGITPMFSLVPEIYFAVKGGTLSVNNPITQGKSTLRLNSLELPVLARFHIRNIYLNAGPYAGYNVGGRMKIESTNTSTESSSKLSFGNGADQIKRLDFGFQAGAGYNFNVKHSILTLDVRYGYGFVNISQDIERYNRMLKISVQVSKPGKMISGKKRRDTDI